MILGPEEVFRKINIILVHFIFLFCIIIFFSIKN